MASHEVLCAVLSFLISKHAWGGPRSREEIVIKTAVNPERADASDIREAVGELRTDAPFIRDHGNRGISLDNSEFGYLADYLFYRCDWDPLDIRTRLKHYEGWGQHDWA